MRADVFKVAKLYITYRYEKEKSRNKANLKEKLTASNVQNQNANVDEHSFGGRMGETAEYVLKEYALNNLVSAKSKRNHNNNEIYIHEQTFTDDRLLTEFGTVNVPESPLQS